ncbi:MAG: shikimate dehydrogenase [Bacteroidaceae bacterium]|nr:shikimate dehydrogenase [Bacteroidaceae bacterium]
MAFPFLVVLTIFFLVLVKNVNAKLNNPDDTSFGSETSASETKEDKDDDFPPVDEEFKNDKEPERESEPVFTQTQEPQPEPEPEPEPQPEPVVPLKTYDSLYGLIGKPLAHSTSMVRFNKFFREQHINAHYNNYELESIEDVTKLIEKYPNLRGFNVTIPYKQDIIPYLNRLDETAQSIGAVNTVKVLHRDGGVELVGYNTDWTGFTKSFGELLEGHSKALILGTGGVSKAVKYALDKMGIENKFVSRNSNFEIMGYYELSPSVMEEFDVIVNCTPMGMWPDVNQCPDIPYTFLSDKHLLLDVIANPDETMFMKKGRDHGATAKGGKEMLEQQAVAAWEIWERIGE